MSSSLPISAAARGKLRTAITGNAGWYEYKKATGKGIADYRTEDYWTACSILKIDAEAIVKSAESENAMKERTRDNYEVCQLRARFDVAKYHMTQSDSDKAEGIFTSITRYGEGRATEAQFKAIEKLVDSAEKGTGAQTQSTDSATTATAAPPAPVAPITAPSPAGSAMWEIIRDAARADMDPMVRDLVGRALESVPKVQIE